jgi:FkbM family methyltransferase
MFLWELNKRFPQVVSSPTYLFPLSRYYFQVEGKLSEESLIMWSKEFCSTDKNFLDIGAHTGTYTLTLAPHCKHVYAFEPQKFTYYGLCGGIALSNYQNVTAYNTAIGSNSQRGKMTLKVISPDGGGSSILPLSTHENPMASETVDVKSLDEDFSIDDIGFIKIDVEGNESYVLEGAKNTLARSNFPPIIFEYQEFPQYQEVNGNLKRVIRELGYDTQPISGYENLMVLATRK